MANVPGKTVFFTAFATAWLALAVIFAGIFVIEEHDHEHIDAAGRRLPFSENCHVCLEIQIAQRLIEAFGRLGISIAVIGFIPCAGFFVKPQIFYSKKPTELKVRFNC
jgi:predicted transporter